MTATQRPSREEFIAFWKEAERRREDASWREFLPHVLYPGYLAIAVFVVRWLDSESRFWLPSVIVAIGYVFLAPYLWITGYIIETDVAASAECQVLSEPDNPVLTGRRGSGRDHEKSFAFADH